MKLKNRHFLRDKDIKKLEEELKDILGENFYMPARIESGFMKDAVQLYLMNGVPFFVRMVDLLIPTLKAIMNKAAKLPKVTVDMGAVGFITNGADIMVPGIVKVDDKVDKYTLVMVTDEKHDKPLAIGLALMDAETIKNSKKGPAIKNLHHVGDDIWNFE
ncbi:MAG: RNA-binding protein [Candidatus Jordarchaeum sp.]|uniref:RNA-binding protein n=1 Tax=Candidatus Jordarchaeum sp. TaxID=2823881 RepID=UPI00404AC9A1